MAELADPAPAAELMENAVAQVSRYLDRIGAPLSSRKHGLLMLAFGRSLRRYASRSTRLELAGTSTELANRIAEECWVAQAHTRLELERIVRCLSDRNANVLLLRAAGYEWKEIADLLGPSAAALRNGFWREITRIRWNWLWGPTRGRCHSDFK
jgi:DNA-directed RNA polymerase specialized sigma24 family protein